MTRSKKKKIVTPVPNDRIARLARAAAAGDLDATERLAELTTDELLGSGCPPLPGQIGLFPTKGK